MGPCGSRAPLEAKSNRLPHPVSTPSEPYLAQKALAARRRFLARESDAEDSSLQALLGGLPWRLLAPRRGGPVHSQDCFGPPAPRLASHDAHPPLLALVPCEAMTDHVPACRTATRSTSARLPAENSMVFENVGKDGGCVTRRVVPSKIPSKSPYHEPWKLTAEERQVFRETAQRSRAAKL